MDEDEEPGYSAAELAGMKVDLTGAQRLHLIAIPARTLCSRLLAVSEAGHTLALKTLHTCPRALALHILNRFEKHNATILAALSQALRALG
eukprot:1157270-Pelagomonas_calceolata.AAC.12